MAVVPEKSRESVAIPLACSAVATARSVLLACEEQKPCASTCTPSAAAAGRSCSACSVWLPRGTRCSVRVTAAGGLADMTTGGGGAE